VWSQSSGKWAARGHSPYTKKNLNAVGVALTTTPAISMLFPLNPFKEA
jgi:hypothetical protein